ncbi:hypothetical protein DZA65_03180 [Dickeya dianthicola]|uniref:hypothetical protein n=1 Tax=Dickeya dianthicola TaxID=204039 RepID=UPI000CD3BA16|nr:hypothetical protein [Dickeya dianthicola]AYC20055.1 hypothetical protein DZA65_03180 [Dickeya dianthicola]MBI0437103.1 hypothetical protein [Dickeya dianthicola]MBI0448637.1 hypothetical protein [Dickeya dianthicola]MBI0452064.1 hypothetical protein [Dickeya dianthicola]MBI0456358.1 hypothetical protein [Dickeya dianthicola]
MNSNNGGWSYFWGWVTGLLSTLSFQDIIFAAGALFTAVITVLTYLSNARKNQALAAAEIERNRIIGEWVAAQNGKAGTTSAMEIIGHSAGGHHEQD